MHRLDEAIKQARAASEKLVKVDPSYSDLELRRRDVRDTLSQSGLPPWPWCDFGTERFAEVSRRSRGMASFCSKWKRVQGSAVLSGPTAIGKTVCLVALGRRIIKRLAEDPPLSPKLAAWARRVRFCPSDSLVMARKGHPLGRGEAPEIERASSAGLLLLDNLGNESEDRDGVLFQLIDRRYMAGLPTVLTTHLKESELRQRYGDAMVRRIVDHGSFVLPGGAT